MELGTDSLSESLRCLYSRTSHGIKLGLELEAELLEKLGNPQLRMPHVHVAGTNGKGSVCAMIESVLRTAGYRTGLYTSPHLVRFNERIRVAGECVSDEELAALFRAVNVKDKTLPRPATFFEFTTAMAFEHFRQQRVEVAVLETGLGGRLDATNVVSPLLSLITRIDIEHTQYLGKTLGEIAGEKAGIIKPNRAVICGAMPDEARAVIRAIAKERNAPFIAVEDAVSVRRTSQDLRGQKVRIESAETSYGQVKLPLIGKYQLENAALAVAAIEYLAQHSPFLADEATVKKGLQSVRWPGRCQVLSEDPVVLLDVAHNPNGAQALAESLREILKGHPIGLVAGLLSDKDGRGFAAALAPVIRRAWAVPIQNERALPQDQLVACLRNSGMEVEAATLADALAGSKAWAKENDGAVCIAGSLFLAGEVLAREGVQP